MRSRRGAHALEFVLCLPIWVTVVAGIMDYAWVFFHQSSLDASANIGCRAASLLDPGESDENIAVVQARATDRMKAAMTTMGLDDCSSCTVEAYTVGEPPERSLVCEGSRTVVSLTTLFFADRTLRTRQVARLEWQRGGAP